METERVPTKTCTKCGKEGVFYKRSGTGKPRSHCKDCARKNNIQWAKDNPDTYKAANRSSSTTWRHNNPERAKEVGRNAQRKFAVEHTAEYMWRIAKYRAPKLGLDFNIEVLDVVVPDVCPVLGTPLKVSVGGKRSDCTPSLDRVNNSMGYVKGNVRVISLRANKLKSDATLAELESLVRYMKEHPQSSL